MMNEDIALLSISEMNALLRGREISPVELIRSSLDRIARYEPRIRSFIQVTAEHAMANARTAEREIMKGTVRGPLHGIPFSLKDIFETAAIPTTAGSPSLIDNIPAADATTVRLLIDAGAILIGKNMTHEFAHGGPAYDLPWPNPENPWKKGYFTGGSSSGSAAAVAAGFCAMSMGSDTGGSIRIPASYCGVVGLKPSYGLVSKKGVITNAFSLDHAGPLTWNVRDCAYVLQAIAGFDPQDPSSANVTIPDYLANLDWGIKGKKIGVIRHFYEKDVQADAEQVGAFEKALEVLEQLGARVVDVQLSPLAVYSGVKLVISASELYAAHCSNLRQHPERFGSVFRYRAMTGSLISAQDYLIAQQQRKKLMLEVENVMGAVDAFVIPSTNGPAGLLEDVSPMAYFGPPSLNAAFNVTGHPAISMCSGFSSDGLPLALQFIGKLFAEDELLRIAQAYESSTPWRQKRPDLSQFQS